MYTGPREDKAAASWAGISSGAGKTRCSTAAVSRLFDRADAALESDGATGSAEIRQPDPADNGESTAASVFVALVFVQIDSCLQPIHSQAKLIDSVVQLVGIWLCGVTSRHVGPRLLLGLLNRTAEQFA